MGISTGVYYYYLVLTAKSHIFTCSLRVLQWILGLQLFIIGLPTTFDSISLQIATFDNFLYDLAVCSPL